MAKYLTILNIVLVVLHVTNGCQIVGHISSAVPITEEIYDTYRGTILTLTTSNIEGIASVEYQGGLIGGPYVEASHSNSQYVLRTLPEFERFEEVEVLDEISITVQFSCTGGGTPYSVMNFIKVKDTNNNAPQFRPLDEFEFVVSPPLPPGFIVTGCFNYITVRDIDLTTQRINFAIEENDYFEIEYDAASSTVSKEFNAILKTKSLIRSLSEPVTLTITATDVDLTGDPPLTTPATIKVVADTQFELPEEPIFSKTFYILNYTDDHQLIQTETIFLEQGFDQYVEFTLDGEYIEHFSMNVIDNQVTITVRNSLPNDVLLTNQIYLIIRANRENTSGGTATIIIQFPKESVLSFENSLYIGSIENNALHLPQLVLIEGYENVAVTARVEGEFSSYFGAIVQGNLITITMNQLTDVIIENNSLISLEVVASSPTSEAITIVSLEIIKDDNVTPVFDKPIYSGTYDPASGLTIERIEFTQGYDDTVNIEIVGEHASYFNIDRDGTAVILTTTNLPADIFVEQHVVLSIEAEKPRTVGANAAVIISLPAAKELIFQETFYKGSIQDNVLTIEVIRLDVGYDESVVFSLSGEHSDNFHVTNEQNEASIILVSPLSDAVITQNSVIILTLTATAMNAVPATTSIIIDILKEDNTTPVFSRNIYYGTYLGTSNIEIESISLSQGYDNGVTFRIDGEHAQYFDLSHTENNVVITLREQIPEELIFTEKVLVFNVFADKALSVGAHAAILIRFPTELTEPVEMKFAQNTYKATLDNEDFVLGNIVLDTGYEDGTQFELSGDFYEHFDLSPTNNVVQITYLNTLPIEAVQDNDFIILEIEARRQRAVSAWTSVVVNIVKSDLIIPVFNQPYYRGTYHDSSLQFNDVISLSDGYEEGVVFELEGESSEWFSLVQNGNSATLEMKSTIPDEVVENNNQLLFTLKAANRLANARAVISIELHKDSVTDPVSDPLQFSQQYYQGKIENENLSLESINLENYLISTQFEYSLIGEFSEYFQLEHQQGAFELQLKTPVPEEITQASLILLVLEIQTANTKDHTVLIIEVLNDASENVQLMSFEESYYTGSYTEGTGLQFTTPISLATGYSSNVQFELEGDNAQWFGLTQNDNSLTLTLTSPIPGGVLANNVHLIFVVTAQGEENSSARATIIISLPDEYTQGSYLGFERVSYLASLENDQVNVPEIVLSEGYTESVVFTLHGELSSFFSLTWQGPTVTVALRDAIPESSQPSNGVIVLEIQASAPPALTAYTTLIIELVRDDATSSTPDLIFASPYYTGSYTEGTGLQFTTPISLATGYSSNVQFELEGDSAQWFGLTQNDNSLTLTLTSPIPGGVLANNVHLIFVVTAQGEENSSARATIIISLPDEYTQGSYLGFERVSYLASIENDLVNIPDIVLSEGYTESVVFTLHGELSSYFLLTWQGPTVTVALRDAIPESSQPSNGVIVLEIQASAPPALTAYTTLIIELVRDDATSARPDLIFASPYYTGSYTEGSGLQFTTPISLATGYNSNVQFELEGDNAQWFGLTQNDNSLTLTLTSPIPGGVLANNVHLIFVVTAQGEENSSARATIIISLPDEYTQGSYLGFERVSYIGSVENDQVNVPEIVLSEGYTESVVFTLHGELSSFFSLTWQGPTVTVALRDAIPESSQPSNGVIVLEIQASAPPALTAYTTLIIELVRDDATSSTPDLIFASPYYTGSYTEGTGLQFTTPISLATGYSSNVQFELEGDSAQWFGLTQNDNSLTLTLTSPIPGGVLANNVHLIFVVTAQGEENSSARATIIISLPDEYTQGSYLGFERVSYIGSVKNDQVNFPEIVLSEGYTESVVFTLHGELSSYFSLTWQGPTVTVALRDAIPESSQPSNGVIVLEIQASAPPALTAYTTLIIELVRDDATSSTPDLIFASPYYTGSYTEGTGLQFTTPISLATGYSSNVQFELEGDNAQWFGLSQNDNSLTLTLTSPIPAGVLANNVHLIFVATAQGEENSSARATIIISLPDEYTEGLYLGFERVSYLASLENNQFNIPEIVLSEGYTESVVFTLHGELSSYFSLTWQGPTVTVALCDAIPESSQPSNGVIVLEIQASAPPALTAYTTLIIELVRDDATSSTPDLIFASPYYTGSYTEGTGLQFTTPISLATGYSSNVQFELEGDSAQWFGLTQNDNSLTLTLTSPIPGGVLANNVHLIFVVTAQGEENSSARATIIISLPDEYTQGSYLGFERVSYLASLENDQVNVPEIVLSEGYTESVVFTLHGELSSYFSLTWQGPTVTVALRDAIPESSQPSNGVIVLEIQASAPPALTAYTTLIIELVRDDATSSTPDLIFASPYYTGSYTEGSGLQFTTPISLATGYSSNVQFELEGDDAQWFGLTQSDNSLTLTLTSPIPEDVQSNNIFLIFVVTAKGDVDFTARATIVISLEHTSQVEPDVSFSKILYDGVIEDSVLYHETITVNGYTGSNIELLGVYSPLFNGEIVDGIVTITIQTSTTITDVTHIPLELRAGGAGAILLINVKESGNGGSVTPVVTFSSQSYAIRVDITQTGTVGRVEAIADNGEPVTYSLLLDNSHLEERLSINSIGELHLSAPVDSGFYTTQVLATTILSQISGTATVHLSVETVTVCGDELVMPPLIVIDRDEEEPHRDLINGTLYEGCRFVMNNRWPLDQNWLYVDETGLHTTAIDREHESIAFMALSQVQVEITLHCDTDATRVKRSLNSDSLGPYDYGNNKWLLSDSILYNSRRTLFNLIVNDINDNAPIFDGKSAEPIAVGCPIPELQGTVMPRSLAELHATDADIGENAAIMYWSSDPEISVSPTSGFVHLSDRVTLEQDYRLIVNATDRNGQGLTGSIELIVKLLDETNIAVVTVRDAFLDDETAIVSNLKDAVGYDVKVLRSAINPQDTNETRKKRDVTSNSGTTLQLYVYGLVDRDPVTAVRLIEDINSSGVTTVNIASSVSLEDHLAGQEICVISGRETSLLVATIVLSVLLFVILMMIAVWYFLKWRKGRLYNRFSDVNSLASRNESLEGIPKPEIAPMPRLNIEELKKSERRLQEMLNAPIPKVSFEPDPPKTETLVDIPLPDMNATIVIQSFDKLKDAENESSDDEFGEVKAPKRKSVVTFNENVEKIIHLEDNDDNEDSRSSTDVEVYQF